MNSRLIVLAREDVISESFLLLSFCFSCSFEWIDKEEMASAAAAANVVKLFVEIEAAIADENNGKVLELANQGK